jgi:nitroimidazol reductase NimA-like FMN-containing flavoprotein (pyridoxamine 5'-phosphate oxidase superfamily)
MNSKIITKLAELEEIINQSEVCYMGMVDENGLPYTVPFNFAYEDSVLYFHSAPFGKKIDILKKKPDVCIAFSLGHELHHHDVEVGCSYSMKYRSVLAYGKVEFIEDIEQKTSWMNKIMLKYTQREFKYSLPAITNVACYRVVIEKMTGKKRGY